MPAELDTTGILTAARVIRPYLPALVGPDDAPLVDRALAAQLTSVSPPATAAHEITILLDGHPVTRRFLRTVLADVPYYRPPALQQDRFRVSSRGLGTHPAGDPAPVDATRYCCLHADYIWYQPEIGSPVPMCPTHQTALVRG